MVNEKGRQLVLDALAAYPNHGSLTLAKMLYKGANRKIWNRLETCRNQVRYYRGRLGKKNRSNIRFKKYIGTGMGIFNLPESDEKPWLPYEMQNIEKALVIADIHVPYHNVHAVEKTLEYAIESGLRECNGRGAVVLNGDIADHYQLSRWEKDPTERRFSKELEMVRHFLAVIRDTFPEAQIIYKQGNHERRYELYMKAKAPELFDCAEFRPEKLFRLEEMGIEWVDEKRPIYLDKLSILHGDEFWKSFSSPVNPARGAFLKTKDVSMVAHHHQTSMHDEPNLRGKSLTCWSIGCLCELHPQYMPFNKWNHGFAMINCMPHFVVDNKRIIKDMIV